jgi:hypothetical protein
MDEEVIKKIKEQHIDNYRKAILENIKNNTEVLVDEDIMSLIRKPPLDSMDLIRTKFLDLAKKNKTILNIEELNDILNNYRNDISTCLKKIKKLRIDELSKKTDIILVEDDTEVIKIIKKDFINLNKQIKKIFKDQLQSSFDDKIIKNINNIYLDNLDDDIKNKITQDISKYIKGSYQRQLLDNLDIKIMVKDTTLINGTKEQADRYLFTLNNSRLLNDNLSY